MAKILIPRSDSVDVKVIEPSDFESYFSDDLLNNYIKDGFTLAKEIRNTDKNIPIIFLSARSLNL